MTLVPLSTLTPTQHEALAQLTFEAAAEHSPLWLPTLDAAVEELAEAAPKHALVTLEAEIPTGWIAAARSWGRIWEIHPLIVGVAHQHRGIGSQLVTAVEAIARAHGALTMILGTSDNTNATSLSNLDLYVDTGTQIAATHAHRSHPVAFWQHVGYTVVGVIPDAEGPGMPSIQLAKRLAP
jgi:aminoglycoside 6'-N-acetyltransferase I